MNKKYPAKSPPTPSDSTAAQKEYDKKIQAKIDQLNDRYGHLLTAEKPTFFHFIMSDNLPFDIVEDRLLSLKVKLQKEAPLSVAQSSLLITINTTIARAQSQFQDLLDTKYAELEVDGERVQQEKERLTAALVKHWRVGEQASDKLLDALAGGLVMLETEIEKKTQQAAEKRHAENVSTFQQKYLAITEALDRQFAATLAPSPPQKPLPDLPASRKRETAKVDETVSIDQKTNDRADDVYELGVISNAAAQMRILDALAESLNPSTTQAEKLSAEAKKIAADDKKIDDLIRELETQPTLLQMQQAREERINNLQTNKKEPLARWEKALIRIQHWKIVQWLLKRIKPDSALIIEVASIATANEAVAIQPTGVSADESDISYSSGLSTVDLQGELSSIDYSTDIEASADLSAELDDAEEDSLLDEPPMDRTMPTKPTKVADLTNFWNTFHEQKGSKPNSQKAPHRSTAPDESFKSSLD